LEDKITERSQAILLMQMGFLNSYVDFFYITSHADGAPSAIEINLKLQQEMGHNKSRKQKF